MINRKINLTELKKIIRETVQDSLSQSGDEQKFVSMSGGYRWKEAIMKAVQDALYARGDMVDSQDQLEGAIDEEIQKIREDLDVTLSMIGRALYQVPFQVFKAPKPTEK